MNLYYFTWILPLSYLILGLSIAWVITFLIGKWWLKLTLVIATTIASLGWYAGIQSLLGNPRKMASVEELYGREGDLYSEVLYEPKSIYLLFKGIGDDFPKLYEIPYSREDAKKSQQVGLGIEKNGSIHIIFGRPSSGNKTIEKGSGGTFAPGEFYILPPITNKQIK